MRKSHATYTWDRDEHGDKYGEITKLLTPYAPKGTTPVAVHGSFRTAPAVTWQDDTDHLVYTVTEPALTALDREYVDHYARITGESTCARRRCDLPGAKYANRFGPRSVCGSHYWTEVYRGARLYGIVGGIVGALLGTALVRFVVFPLVGIA
jgi:hypothetical protein